MSIGKRLYEQRLNRPRKTNRKSGYTPIEVEIHDETGLTDQYQRQKDVEAVTSFNTRIQAWGLRVNSALKQSIDSMIDRDKKLSRSLKQNYRHYGKPVQNSEITSIGFSFEAAGLYVHLGVGRGYNMTNGTRTLHTKDNVWRRQPKEWFNPVIERFIPELQEIVSEYCGQLFINTTRIYIKNF